MHLTTLHTMAKNGYTSAAVCTNLHNNMISSSVIGQTLAECWLLLLSVCDSQKHLLCQVLYTHLHFSHRLMSFTATIGSVHSSITFTHV